MAFKKLTKTQAYLMLGVHGPSGAGKTYSCMAIGDALAKASGKRACIIDTEHGSAAKYGPAFPDIDGDEIVNVFDPTALITKVYEAAEAGYGVVIIDSVTPFWNGPGGFCEMVDKHTKAQEARGKKADSFAGWKIADAAYQRFIQKLLSCPIHKIVATRAKQKMEKTADGKVRKIGMEPQMRDGWEYEFDVEAMLDMEHNLVIGKTRCEVLDGAQFLKPGKDVAKILHQWLTDGAPALSPPREVPADDSTQKPEPSAPSPANEAATALADALIALVHSSKSEPVAAAVVTRAKTELESAPDQLARFRAEYVAHVKTLRAATGAAA